MLIVEVCALCEGMVPSTNLGIYDVQEDKWFEVSGNRYSKISFHRELVDSRRDDFEFAYQDDKFVTRYSTYRVVAINNLEFDVYFVVGMGNENSMAALYERCVRELVEQEHRVNLSILIVGDGDVHYDFVLPREERRFWQLVQ